MAYTIRFTKAASAQFKKPKDKKLKERLACALEFVAKEPLSGKPLQAEFKSCYSYRVGDYRIIYSFFKEERYLSVIRIDHRREVYR